jgi:hypothetical protein
MCDIDHHREVQCEEPRKSKNLTSQKIGAVILAMNNDPRQKEKCHQTVMKDECANISAAGINIAVGLVLLIKSVVTTVLWTNYLH